jgi:hypothetical protein
LGSGLGLGSGGVFWVLPRLGFGLKGGVLGWVLPRSTHKVGNKLICWGCIVYADMFDPAKGGYASWLEFEARGTEWAHSLVKGYSLIGYNLLRGHPSPS